MALCEMKRGIHYRRSPVSVGSGLLCSKTTESEVLMRGTSVAHFHSNFLPALWEEAILIGWFTFRQPAFTDGEEFKKERRRTL